VFNGELGWPVPSAQVFQREAFFLDFSGLRRAETNQGFRMRRRPAAEILAKERTE
jgi:hypothetical protein